MYREERNINNNKVENKLKTISELGTKFRKSKNNEEKENIEKELQDILNEIKKDAIEKFKSESDIKKFLDNIVRFNNYSFNNQMLIWVQRPDAEYVSSFKTYSQIGYKVNKGAKGIKIFIPNFYNLVKISNGNDYEIKPYFALTEEEKKKYKDKDDDSITFYKQKLSGFTLGNVFDVKDTDMTMEKINEELNPVLNDKTAEDIMDCFIKTIYSDGFKVEYQDIEGTTKGYCDFKKIKLFYEKVLVVLFN